MVHWRLGSKERTKGRYWWVETGRGADRRQLVLGYLTEAEAKQALATMNREEEATEGTPQHGRIFVYYKDDPAGAIHYLVTGDGARARFGPEPVDHGALVLKQYYETIYKPARSVKRPRSWVNEEGHWRQILPVLGHVRLREVDAHLVADYVDELRVTRGEGGERPASGTTKRLHRSAVQALLKYAHRQRHIPEHVDLAVFPIEGSTRRVTVKPDPLTLDELVKLMDASTPKHRAMWAVGAGEGLRPSELRRLRWEDVRWATRTLVVRGDDEGLGKTALSVAEIPLTPIAHRELMAWWMRGAQPESGVMFPSDVRGGEKGAEAKPYTSETAYRRALKNAAKRAKIGRRVNMYLLRDSFATIAWSLGIDMDVARRILRHADETMLREVYCRPRPADLVARVAAFDVPGAG
jgi:integrase